MKRLKRLWLLEGDFVARIRTIKPEFPQSESMGRVSRNARLLFILLWTIVDDSGVTRGNSRMLASLLFPYDDDAKDHIDEWMSELESEDCIVRYQSEGQAYLQIRNWLNHQKIDKPTPSKLPQFANSSEDSRILHVGMEGNGIGKDKEKIKKEKPPRKSSAITIQEFFAQCEANGEKRIPEDDSVFDYAEKIGITLDMVRVCWNEFARTHMESGRKQTDWRATFRNYVRKNYYKLWYVEADGSVKETPQYRALKKVGEVNYAQH